MHTFRPGHAWLPGLLIVLLATVSSAAQTLYSTDFDGQSGRPEGWKVIDAPSTQFWILYDGEFMTGNGDLLTSGDGRSFAVVDIAGSSQWGDYTVSADVWMSQRNGLVGLVGRWRGPLEHYEGSIEFDEGRRIARIIRSTGGMAGGIPQRDVLAETYADDGASIPNMANGFSARDAHRLSLQFDGSAIVLSIDGRELLRASDSAIAQGTAGLVNQKNFAYYDEFTVEGTAGAGAAGAAPTPRMRPAATATPRMTPAAISTPALQAESLNVITRPVPETILRNMDLAEMRNRLTPEEQEIYEQMSEADQLRLLRNIRTRMTSASGGGAEMAVELERLERELQNLTEQQKLMASSLEQRLQQEQDVAQGLIAIDTLQDVGNVAGALSKTSELLQKYPANSLLLDKKRALERSLAGSYEGYEEDLARNEKTYTALAARARQQEESGNLQSAQSTWTTVLALSPAKDEWLTQANSKISALNQQVLEREREVAKLVEESGLNKNIAFAAIGLSVLIGLIVFVALRRFSKRSRERDEQIMTHVQDLTQPLVDMQAEIRQLTGTGALALPDMEPSEAPAPEAPAPPAPGKKDKKKARKDKKARKAEAQEAPAEESPLDALGMSGLEDTLGSGGDEDLFPTDPLAAYKNEEESPAQSEADLQPSGAESGEADGEDPFAGLDFGGISFSSPEMEEQFSSRQGEMEGDGPEARSAEASAEVQPVPREEVPQPQAEAEDDGPLDLGLDDLLDSTAKQPAQPTEDWESQTVKLETGSPDADGQEQGLNLDLDLGGEDDAEEREPAVSSGPTEEISIDLFPEDTDENGEPAPVSAHPEPVASSSGAEEPKAASQAQAAAATAPGLIFEQDFEEDGVGQVPRHWSGDEKENVAFHVVESNSSKVLRYFKSAGTDSVHFFCRFPNVGGTVGIEFDLCCPQKNKYLLGLYVELDGNYNQAVRTVIHCIDPSAASVRMQNEPVSYSLGEWCHVRYVIDLQQGVIDGFLDDEQVLEQQTFVNKPGSINTLSIRDNHATTGELLIDNIRVEKLA